jgi:hypothetical protein
MYALKLKCIKSVWERGRKRVINIQRERGLVQMSVMGEKSKDSGTLNMYYAEKYL